MLGFLADFGHWWNLVPVMNHLGRLWALPEAASGLVGRLARLHREVWEVSGVLKQTLVICFVFRGDK